MNVLTEVKIHSSKIKGKKKKPKVSHHPVPTLLQYYFLLQLLLIVSSVGALNYTRIHTRIYI